MIRVDGDTAHVTTASEALELCAAAGVAHVVIDDDRERARLATMLRKMS